MSVITILCLLLLLHVSFVSATIGLPRECPSLLVVLWGKLGNGIAFMAGLFLGSLSIIYMLLLY